jgi:Leu/Phe-tRNA-protein transferase
MHTDHLASLGVKEIPREKFINHLQLIRNKKLKKGCWDKQPILCAST